MPQTNGETRPKEAIVTTTINVPKLLEAYVADAKAHGQSPLIVVIADKKTPPEAAGYCADLKAHTGADLEYFSIERQEEYLERFVALKAHLPYNSIMRRNIGMLYAYERGVPKIITIDDDNFLATQDYLATHRLGERYEADMVHSNTGWVNVCAPLREKFGRVFYHRGFPLEKRTEDEMVEIRRARIRPVINAGLWLGDPDVGGMDRLWYLTKPLETTEYTRSEGFAVATGTWTPFNSQNTALLREVIPAYFLSPFLVRYDDIWASYVVKRIADHLGDSITFGFPLVKQERNPHDHWRDLSKELYEHALVLRFTEMLHATALTGKSYRECFAELAAKLPSAFSARSDIKPAEQELLNGFFEGMRVWVETFDVLEGKSR